MTAYRYWRLLPTRWCDGYNGEINGDNSFWVSALQYVVGGITYPAVELTSNNTPAPYVVSAHDNLFRSYQGFKTEPYFYWNAFSSTGAPRSLTIDMGAAYAFEEVRLSSGNESDSNPYLLGFNILASETGAFTGEEVVRLSYLNGGIDSVWAGTYPATVTFPFAVAQSSGTATARVTLPPAGVFIASGTPAGSVGVILPPVKMHGASGGVAGSVLPGLVVSATGRSFGGSESMLPALTQSALGAAVGSASLRMLTAASFSGSSGSFGLPMHLASGIGSVGTLQSAYLGLPAIATNVLGGVNTSSNLPALTSFATATFTGWVQTSALLPGLQVGAAGTSGVIGGTTTELPMLGSSGNGGANGGAILPSVTTSLESTAGGIATVVVGLPNILVGLAGTRQSVASVFVALPMLRATNAGVLRVTLPAVSAAASGYASVAYTYEAYAVNLNHKEHPGIIPTDEVTRYTNFPFDKIIRFKGDYYGVSATGLVLLGGDSDAGSPIPWAWRTFEHDFESPQKKTLASARLSGRMGLAMTLTVYVGEKGGVSYSYTSPRGPDVQNYRQVFGRGVQARYFALGAAGTGDFALDTLEFDTITLSRRI